MNDIQELIAGKRWKTVQLTIKDLDKHLIEQGATEEKIKESSLYEQLQNFEFTTYKDTDHLEIKKPEMVAGETTYKISKNNNKFIFSSLTKLKGNQQVYGTDYTILGVNDTLLYLTQDKRMYGFDSYYNMKKQ